MMREPEGWDDAGESGPWRTHWQIGGGYVTSRDHHEECRIKVWGPYKWHGQTGLQVYYVTCDHPLAGKTPVVVDEASR